MGRIPSAVCTAHGTEPRRGGPHRPRRVCRVDRRIGRRGPRDAAVARCLRWSSLRGKPLLPGEPAVLERVVRGRDAGARAGALRRRSRSSRLERNAPRGPPAQVSPAGGLPTGHGPEAPDPRGPGPFVLREAHVTVPPTRAPVATTATRSGWLGSRWTMPLLEREPRGLRCTWIFPSA